MIAYEMQLRYVIRDNVRDKNQSKKKFENFFFIDNFVLDVVSDLQCAFLTVLDKSFIITKRYIHTAINARRDLFSILLGYDTPTEIYKGVDRKK